MNIDSRIIEQFNKNAPFELTKDNLLVLGLVGSTSHNTYIPPEEKDSTDDVDYLGIVVEPKSYIFGVDEWEGLNFQHEELDCCFYSFKKFIKLLIKSNPNVLGMLWLKPEHYVYNKFEWQILLSWKNIFSSKKAFDSFKGYSMSQLHKMTALTKEAFEGNAEMIKMCNLAGWSEQDIVNKKMLAMPDYQAILKEYPTDFGSYSKSREETIDDELNFCRKKIIEFHAKYHKAYMGAKRKAKVEKFGYDCSNSSHLIRLLRLCNEFLKTEQLNVYRTTDAEELKNIKKGIWTLDQIKAEADKLSKQAEILVQTTKLPDEPDIKRINEVMEIIYKNIYIL